ncbi:MAG: DUF6600 domain-containing protein [Pyrinomonadaceae bacterium]
MHTFAKFLLVTFCAAVICICGCVFAFGAAAATINLPASGYVLQDDDTPEVTDRVARISFIRGESKIRRAGLEEWEQMTLNLPIVEGDEIATGESRIEIQFDNQTHLRLAENSYLKVVTLKNNGIAVSLSLGTFVVRITSFDKDRTFFEVDAPSTTLAVQRSGSYRVDAGRQGGAEVRLSADNEGEARVYSANAGFTLKSGRSARIFIDGANAGEWEMNDVSRSSDEFGTWSSDRDSLIAKRLSNAYYDRYYDRDIYGADDLDAYGQWVHTIDYGYIWRPYNSSISRYADWSPYRYGHWRWMPPYGWIWVNDEPWGWATYHHGRWIWDAGSWCWSPYGYIRTSHSWWYPALVVFNIFNNNVSWYPLGYHHRYRNHNWYYNSNHGGHYGGHHNNDPPPQTGGIKVIPPQTGGIKPPPPDTGGIKPPRTDKVPAGAVIAMAINDFGATTKTIKPASASVANAVLTKGPSDAEPVLLPTIATRKVSRDINADTPAVAIRAVPTRVGAAPRKVGEPLDGELRTSRVFGGRTPVTSGETGGIRSAPAQVRDPRKTGAVDREPVRQNGTPVKHAPGFDPLPADEPRSPPVKSAPVRVTPRDAVPFDPPVRQPPREVPTVKSAPHEPVRSEPTRQPTKSDAPPVKSEPKPESKPSRKSDAEGG